MALEKVGLKTVQAGDATAALQALRAHRVDLVLSDIYMPGETGLTLLQAIAERRNPPRVILMTARGTIETTALAQRIGAFDYLAKPFDLGELIARVRAALGDRVRRTKSQIEPGPAVAHRRLASVDDRDVQGHRARGVAQRAGGDPRRERQRQGARRAIDPRPRRPRGRAVHRHQLRRDSRHAARERAVRIDARRVHRLAPGSPRRALARRRRHAVPRRDRRHLAGVPGQAPPLPAGRHRHAARRGEEPSRRRPPDRRHASRHQAAGRRRQVPRGSCTTAWPATRSPSRRCASASPTSRCSSITSNGASRRR